MNFRFLIAPLWPSLPNVTPLALVDIFITAVLIYQFLMIIRGRRAAHVLMGLITLALLYLAALFGGLAMLTTLLEALAPYTAFALIVMFQSEIRRVLARIGRQGFLGWGNRLKRREFIEEILLALDQLSATRTGALIVLERDTGLRTFVESGVLLEAVVSRDLLLSIFHTGNALHDGAVIIQGERIAAAACFVPLSINPQLISTMGSRHRAAIGITEETDCLSLIVSEETGHISIASFGEMKSNLSHDEVAAKIAEHLGGSERPSDPTAMPPREARELEQL